MDEFITLRPIKVDHRNLEKEKATASNESGEWCHTAEKISEDGVVMCDIYEDPPDDVVNSDM